MAKKETHQAVDHVQVTERLHKLFSHLLALRNGALGAGLHSLSAHSSFYSNGRLIVVIGCTVMKRDSHIWFV